MQSKSPKFRIAICGGGVGGLILAYALSKCPDIQIDVYEAASRFSEVGVGIGVWWRPWQILKSLGLEDDLCQLLDSKPTDSIKPTLHYRKADQPEGLGFFNMMCRGGLLTFHRAQFHNVLLKRLSPRCRTYLSKRLHYYTQPLRSGDPVHLVFQDGSTATCDILIGADGLKSAVRASMLHEQARVAEYRGQHAQAADLRSRIEPRWSGVLAYRILVSAEKLRRVSPHHRVLTVPTMYVGKDRHIIAYPISHGQFINIAAFDADYEQEGSIFTDPWIQERDSGEVTNSYNDWEPEVKQLVGCIDEGKVNRWVVNVVKPLPTYAFARVALLGDAAHAMTPFTGAGAGQAIEDAWILSALLSHPRTTPRNVAQVLQIYSRVRLPLASQVAERSRRNGTHFSLHEPGSEITAAGLPELGQRIYQNFEWAWNTDPGVDMRRAMEMLEAEVGGKL